MTQEMTRALQKNPIAPLQESTQQLVEDATAFAREQLDSGLETASGIRDEVSDVIKQRPLVTVLVALGIGLIAGKILSCGK